MDGLKDIDLDELWDVDTLALDDAEEVADNDGVSVRDLVLDAVGVLVLDALLDGDGVCDTGGVMDAVTLALLDLLVVGVIDIVGDIEAPNESDTVALAVLDGVSDIDEVLELVSLADEDGDAVSDGVILIDADDDSLILADGDGDGVRDLVGVTDGVLDEEADEDSEIDIVGEGDSDNDAVRDGDAVLDEDGVWLGVLEFVGVWDGDGDESNVNINVISALPVNPPLSDNVYDSTNVSSPDNNVASLQTSFPLPEYAGGVGLMVNVSPEFGSLSFTSTSTQHVQTSPALQSTLQLSSSGTGGPLTWIENESNPILLGINDTSTLDCDGMSNNVPSNNANVEYPLLNVTSASLSYG